VPRPILILAVTLLLALALPVFAQRASLYVDIGESDLVPEPRILQPYLEVYDLTGKDVLEFKWSPHEGNQTQRDYYDFRLYKGYTVLESTRIYKTRTPPRQWSLSLSSDIFQDGQVYTCTLRQVYTGSLKSRRAFQSFKVIKKSSRESVEALP
jgi:hypothetical protein